MAVRVGREAQLVRAVEIDHRVRQRARKRAQRRRQPQPVIIGWGSRTTTERAGNEDAVPSTCCNKAALSLECKSGVPQCESFDGQRAVEGPVDLPQARRRREVDEQDLPKIKQFAKLSATVRDPMPYLIAVCGMQRWHS